MDVEFLLRAQRMLGQRPVAAIDYGVLVATLRAHQSTTITARAEACARAAPRQPDGASEPLAELVLGGPEWRSALKMQSGCFSRPVARHPVNAP